MCGSCSRSFTSNPLRRRTLSIARATSRNTPTHFGLPVRSSDFRGEPNGSDLATNKSIHTDQSTVDRVGTQRCGKGKSVRSERPRGNRNIILCTQPVQKIPLLCTCVFVNGVIIRRHGYLAEHHRTRWSMIINSIKTITQSLFHVDIELCLGVSRGNFFELKTEKWCVRKLLFFSIENNFKLNSYINGGLFNSVFS